MADEMLAFGAQILAAQPFSVFLGARMIGFAPGHAEIALSLRPEYLQQYGIAHGGALSYLADNALTFAGGSVLGAQVITAEYKINYAKPARGESLLARADVISSSSRQAVCRCDVFAIADGAETLVATALGTIVKRGA